jgi:hypothetical protein
MAFELELREISGTGVCVINPKIDRERTRGSRT